MLKKFKRVTVENQNSVHIFYTELFQTWKQWKLPLDSNRILFQFHNTVNNVKHAKEKYFTFERIEKYETTPQFGDGDGDSNTQHNTLYNDDGLSIS